jgi:D,D-heptose 1,7-bisphosphate phosphatase
MPKAVFLDRDGVINQERKDYVKNLNEFIIFEGVSEAIKILKKHNFLVIIITNQSAINRKMLSIEMLNKIHQYLKNFLNENNTFVDGIYHCPHMPEDNCLCRKPKPGLLLQAMNDFDIDLKQSWMIGNSISDVNTAKAAGCNWILLKNDQTLLQVVRELVK